jgi:predicted PP-loop superfamily ATPase
MDEMRMIYHFHLVCHLALCGNCKQKRAIEQVVREWWIKVLAFGTWLLLWCKGPCILSILFCRI